MAKTRAKEPGQSVRSGAGSKRSGPPPKVAITLRLDAERAKRLQVIAEQENRTLTNYVETALLRDLALRDEASRVITVRAAPGTSKKIAPEDILRGEAESDAAFAKRRDLITDLWLIPDSE